jgi:hypothetical protein
MALKIRLRGFFGAPVRRQARKFTNDQRFDIWASGFLVVRIRADIPDVRVGEADNLSRVAWIRENFLVSG